MRFGCHLASSIASEWAPHYCDYEKLKEVGLAGLDELQFLEQWNAELAKADSFYSEQLASLHERLFKCLKDILGSKKVSQDLWQNLGADLVRDLRALPTEENGAPNESYNEMVTITLAFEKLEIFGALNTTCLRKAVKKYDKLCHCQASAKLLSQLMVARIAYDERTKRLAQTLRGAIDRAAPVLSQPLAHWSRPRATSSTFAFRLRRELAWLKRTAQCLAKDVRDSLVAHRGFHCVEDSNARPLENSLPAYEHAWAMGIRYCECDIACTRDGYLVLNHDEDLKRLTLDPEAKNAGRPVTELSLHEVVATPLASGVRPPLLREILSIATVLGPQAQLVIEIKPSSASTERALAKFLAEEPQLRKQVAVVMSFDLYTMHEFQRCLSEFLGAAEPEQEFEKADDYRPLAMLLTVLEPEVPCELSLKLGREGMLTQVDTWLMRDNTMLDGVYMEWSSGLLGEDREALAALTSKWKVGVWMYAGQPDNAVQAEELVALGVSFINTDLPKSFANTKGLAMHDQEKGMHSLDKDFFWDLPTPKSCMSQFSVLSSAMSEDECEHHEDVQPTPKSCMSQFSILSSAISEDECEHQEDVQSVRSPEFEAKSEEVEFRFGFTGSNLSTSRKFSEPEAELDSAHHDDCYSGSNHHGEVTENAFLDDIMDAVGRWAEGIMLDKKDLAS